VIIGGRPLPPLKNYDSVVVTRRSRQRVVPDPPNLPDEFVSAASDFSHTAEWDGLIAD
jgi:hypothetical protein